MDLLGVYMRDHLRTSFLHVVPILGRLLEDIRVDILVVFRF
jgi:hypothetical protein